MKPSTSKYSPSMELEKIIKLMSLDSCYTMVLPDLGVEWVDLKRALHRAQCAITPLNIAKILRHHAENAFDENQLEDIVSSLRLKLVMTQNRDWKVLKLIDPTEEIFQYPVSTYLRVLPTKMMHAIRSMKNNHNASPVVQMQSVEDLVYLSVQTTTGQFSGSPLYIVHPPQKPVALVSAVRGSQLMMACVNGLGYKQFELTYLHGSHIESLLRIHFNSYNDNVQTLNGMPEYCPKPVITADGIDFTNHKYNLKYVDNILGPNPPLLNSMSILTIQPFHIPSILNKKIKLSCTLKSKDIAKTLKSWVARRIIPPNSELFKVFMETNSNHLVYEK